MDFVFITKRKRVHTSLGADVKRQVDALAKKYGVPATLIINSLCAAGLKTFKPKAKPKAKGAKKVAE